MLVVEKSRAKPTREKSAAPLTLLRRTPSARPANQPFIDCLSLLKTKVPNKKAPNGTKNCEIKNTCSFVRNYSQETSDKKEAKKQKSLGIKLVSLNKNLNILQQLISDNAKTKQKISENSKTPTVAAQYISTESNKRTGIPISIDKQFSIAKKGSFKGSTTQIERSSNQNVNKLENIQKKISAKAKGSFVNEIECDEKIKTKTTKTKRQISILTAMSTKVTLKENSGGVNRLSSSKDREAALKAGLSSSQSLQTQIKPLTKKPFYPSPVHDTFTNSFSSESVMLLIKSEDDYIPDPQYLERSQKNLKWEMRAILIDWLQEVCANYLFKRETLHYAINYIDRYLSIKKHIETNELQLVGVTALFLSAKMDEIYTPKLESMVKVTNNTYSASAIRDLELSMYKVLQLKITPPTLNMWAQLFINEWDRFLRPSVSSTHKELFRGKQLPKFKEPNEKSYCLFRELMQLIDLCLLEVQTLQYNTRAIVASFMYIVIGKKLEQFSSRQVLEEFPYSSLYLLDQSFAYNRFFGEFVEKAFNFNLTDLLPTIQFASTFCALPVEVEFPLAAKMDPQGVLEGHFEEFLAYQTHMADSLQFILHSRNRKLF